MSDFIDSTVDREETIVNATIANRVRYTGKSSTHCVSCGEEIPQGRRVALPGVKLCVECAE